MQYFQFVLNKHLVIDSNAFVSSSIFIGLSDGAIHLDRYMNLTADLCVFEEIVKGGNGACFFLNNTQNISISKCSAKNCNVYTVDDTAAGHFIYYNNDKNDYRADNGFLLKLITASCCATTIGYNEYCLVRVSVTNSITSDTNFTDCNTWFHSLLFRQNTETNLKRILIHRMNTMNSFFYFEYGSIKAENIFLSEINYSDHYLISIHSNSLAFIDSSFQVENIKLYPENGQITFEKCYFNGSLPSHSNVKIISTTNFISFGKPVICARDIYEEINNNYKLLNRCPSFSSLLLNLFM